MKRSPVILLLWSVILTGCETAVQPYVGTPEPYTLWGVLNANADTQVVRVFTVEGEPGIDRPAGIDASVSSTNLATGERVEWRHREVIYADGVSGHVFWAPFRPERGTSYRLEVVRSDGQASTAQVTIPPPVDVEVDRSGSESRPQVRIVGRAPNLIGVVVRYEATNLPPTFVWPEDRPIHPLVEHPVDISYQNELEIVDGGWEFTILMARDYELVRDEYLANCLVTGGAPGIVLRRVELRFIAADSSWFPPGGVFDPDLLVEPNTMSNVQNGFGFIGAGHVVRIGWTPPRQVREDLGYEQEPPCNFAGGPRPIPECMEPPIPCIGENAEDIWTIFF